MTDTNDTDSTAPSNSDDDTLSSPVDRGKAYLTALAVANGQSPPSGSDIDDHTAEAVGRQISAGDGSIDTQARDGGPKMAGDVNSASTSTSQSQSQEANSHRTSMSGAIFGGTDHRRGWGGPGYQYGDTRDTWEVLGYPEMWELSAEDYIARSRRQDPAHVICNKPVEASWKQAPEIIDDSHEEEDEGDTQFEEDLAKLLNAETDLMRGLLHYLEWADREQRPGEFGLLFIGFDDGRRKDQPVDVSQINGPEDVRYIRPFNQADVGSWEMAGDIDDEDMDEVMPPGTVIGEEDYIRPDMPLIYNVQFAGRRADGQVTATKSLSDDEDDNLESIHWTRVVHIVETPTKSEFIGQSCLEPILNRLIDFEKVLGASAEMYWSGADRKYFLSAGGGQDMVDDDDIEWLDTQFQMMSHNMRQAIYTQNMEFETIDGQAVDPSGIINALYQSMAGVSGLPQRIMTGTERGDLASSLDQATWFGRIHERQQQFCEPSLLRPVIDRLIQYGALSEPSNSDSSYTVEWTSLFELTDIEKANLGLTISRTFKELENAIAMGSPRDFAYEEAGYQIPEDKLEELEELDEAVRAPDSMMDEMGDPSSLPGGGGDPGAAEPEESGNEPAGDPSHGSGDGDGAGGGETRPANMASGRAQRANVGGGGSGGESSWSHTDLLARGRVPNGDTVPTTQATDGDRGPTTDAGGKSVLSPDEKRRLAIRREVLGADSAKDSGSKVSDSTSSTDSEASADD